MAPSNTFNPKGGKSVQFNPDTDVPSLDGKVIFITGGTAGLGAESARKLAAHNPEHIYISGRNRKAAETLIASIQSEHPKAGLTFVEMDMTSLASVKKAAKTFTHSRLDTLMCNAGIMAQPPMLGKDGYEIQFATNHLGHAMLIQCLLPTLLKTAEEPNSDVRVLLLTSLGYGGHPMAGICFDELDAHSTFNRFFLGSWIRYGQSKLANILYASELAKRYPQLTTCSIHPGVVLTDLVHNLPWHRKAFTYTMCWLQGIKFMEPHQGCWNQVWCAVGAGKDELRKKRNGGFWLPVGVEAWDTLDKTARNDGLAGKLWEWTEGVLSRF